MSAKITVIGSANVDFIVRLPRLPVRGETVAGGPFSQAFGGKGSNQAIAARRAGGDVGMVASLGSDDLGRQFLDLFKEEGMDTANVVRREGTPCGVALIQVDAAGDNTIAIAPGANELVCVEQVDEAGPAIAAADIVMLQMEIPDAPLRRVLETAERHGVEVMLNFAPFRPTGLVLDRRAGILVVNETEAGGLAGMAVSDAAGAEAAARKLQAAGGHRLVIVTLGANGCVTLEDGRFARHPSFRINAVDATAAGDAFCGALAVALGEKRPLPEAVRFASAAGALTASRFGAVPSVPKRKEIEAFLAAHPE